MPMANCPECDAEVHVDEDIEKGDIIECDDCGATLEVVGLDPVELDVASEDEDEEYFDDDDDEY